MITPAALDAITACGMLRSPNCGAPNNPAVPANVGVTNPGVVNPNPVVGAATASKAWILAVAAAAATAAAGGSPPGVVEVAEGGVMACKPKAFGKLECEEERC